MQNDDLHSKDLNEQEKAGFDLASKYLSMFIEEQFNILSKDNETREGITNGAYFVHGGIMALTQALANSYVCIRFPKEKSKQLTVNYIEQCFDQIQEQVHQKFNEQSNEQK